MDRYDLTFDRLRAFNVDRLAHMLQVPPEERPMAPDHVAETWSVNDWFTAMVGEVGELGNLLKKIRRGDFDNDQDAMDAAMAEVKDELGDVQGYLDLLAWKLGISLEDATRDKWDRVSQRALHQYPHKLMGSFDNGD